MSDRFVRLTASFFYIGFFPLAPGSLASVAGAMICYFLNQSPFFYILILLIVTILGFKVSSLMEALAREKDPSCIVIDEVSGMMIAFFLLPWTFSVVFTTFFLFRAFDMFKIYPANKMEKIQGGPGVMLDDIVAGLYTNIIMQIAVRLAGMT